MKRHSRANSPSLPRRPLRKSKTLLPERPPPAPRPRAPRPQISFRPVYLTSLRPRKDAGIYRVKSESTDNSPLHARPVPRKMDETRGNATNNQRNCSASLRSFRFREIIRAMKFLTYASCFEIFFERVYFSEMIFHRCLMVIQVYNADNYP